MPNAPDSPLPDALDPRAYDSHHGRDESYWLARNALVDAVRVAGAGAPSAANAGEAFSLWCRSAAGVAYLAALDALKAFDAANGGTPIL